MTIHDEPQADGLIDHYWLFNVFIVPTIIIAVTIGLLYVIALSFKCPYIEVVDSCFPYNLPNWAKVVFPLTLFIVAIGLIIYVRRLSKEIN
ncbi:MAG TPA: hypothetical protein VIR31_05890 [Nitrososphaeraceae archaeon]